MTTAVDLFCGAGGMALGMGSAGIDVLLAADKWESAIASYRANLRHPAQSCELTWDSELPTADIIAGGPPCQGFSSAGVRRPGDARNTLVAVFAHLIVKNRPAAFVFENVEGFLTGDNGRWVVDLLEPIISAGYTVSLRKVNAANYGVPQHRKRVLVVGGLGWNPGIPSPTHHAHGAPGAELTAHGLPSSPSVARALAALAPARPTRRSDSSPHDDHHTYRPPNEADTIRISQLGPGQTMRDLPEELWHETYRRRANRRVQDGTPTERRGGAPAGLRRLDPNAPSKAVTSGATSEFIHPYENRPLTLRECARLQTFPDTFCFRGTRSEVALQIGNAVPPLLSEVLFKHLVQRFTKRNDLVSTPGLVEYTPTLSSGMSPALLATCRAVERVVKLPSSFYAHHALENASSLISLL